MMIPMTIPMAMMISATNLDDDFNYDLVDDKDFKENFNDYSTFPTMISRTISITITMSREYE